MSKRQLLGIGISIIFVYFAFRDIDFEEFLSAIKEAEYIWLLPAFAAMVVSFWLRGYRWKYILNPVKEVSTTAAFSATMIGYMANNVLPFRIGDIVRLIAIWKDSGVSKAAALGSVIIERIFDLFMVLAIFGLALISYPNLPRWAVGAGYTAMGLFIALIVFSIYSRNNIESFVKLNNFIAGKISESAAAKSEAVIRSFSDGLKVIHDVRQLFWLVFLSIILWTINILWVWFAIEIFDFNLPFTASLLILVFILFAVSIPSAPGYVGTFHGFVIAGFVFMGIDVDLARASAVVMHATNYIPVTLMGLYFLFKSNITLKSASKGSSFANDIENEDEKPA